MNVWNSVKALPDHPRGGSEDHPGGQAGVVINVGGLPATVDVAWDTDSQVESVPVEQLTVLS